MHIEQDTLIELLVKNYNHEWVEWQGGYLFPQPLEFYEGMHVAYNLFFRALDKTIREAERYESKKAAIEHTGAAQTNESSSGAC